MPFRERARRALRRAVPCFGSSRSPSPVPAPHPPGRPSQPADDNRNDLQEPSGCQSAPQQPLPTSEDGSAAPVVASQEPSDGIPIKATQEDLSLDLSYHEEPATATTASPSERPQPSISQEKSTSTWYAALKATVDLVVQVSDVFPPLKSTAAGIKALMEVHEAFFNNQEEFEKLALRVEFLEKILRDRRTLPAGIEDRRDGLARAAEDLGKQLEEKTSQSTLKRLVSTNDDKQEILRLIREVNFAIEFAVLDVVVTNEGLTLRAVEGIDWLNDRVVEASQKIQQDLHVIAHGVAKLNKSDQLKKLGSVKGYGLSPDAPQCVAGSRIALIARLLAWAEDPSSVHAFWLSGMAGTGKTAISRTFCHQLIKRGLLGASFFCSIKVQDLSDVRNIIPSLAKTLAERYPGFGNALADVLESGTAPLVDEMKLSEQYDFLIIRPAEAALRDFDKNIVLCADALDECRAPAALKEFLETILSKKPVGRLKFFFTSRPEVAIRQAVESAPHSLHRKSLRLHDIEKDIVRSDIKLFVNHELSGIPELQDEYGGCWPPPEVDRIVERADALFIVAATIIRRISGDGESGNPVRRLKTFGRVDASTGVQQLYVDILEKATSGLEDSEKEDLHSCLSLLVAAQRPLSVAEYAALLGRTISDVAAAFRSLHSVVEMPANREDDRAISVYHASFVDFLTGYSTTDTGMGTGEMKPPWAVDRREANSMAFEGCLALMDSEDRKKGLYLGVSGALTSYLSNEDQQLPRLRSDLAYACTTWGNHALDGIVMSNSMQQRMMSFLNAKGLYWLEALSAERSVEYSNILWGISKIVVIDGLANLLIDIRDFAQMFATPIAYSAPHLYLSAIPFQRAASPKPASWLPLIPSIPIVHAAQGNHSTILVDLRELVDEWAGIKHIAISPDGSRLAAGAEDMVWICNAQSGQLMMNPIEGHSEKVTSVSFSPDGTRIVSGSRDETIRVWDVQSGQLVVGPMAGHSGSIHSVAFCPSGGRIVSGSDDNTIRIWDAESGKLVVGPMKGHSDRITSVAFSPDGAIIISGSRDDTIRIWDAQSGKLVVDPMKGHSSWVNSVAFSPDGARVVSGSDDETVRVWDAQSGELVVGPMEGHTEEVTSVAFSLDGAKIASGSDDGTIRVWDAQSGELVLGPMKGHSDRITSVIYLPDGLRVISASRDKTIRAWPAQSAELVVGPPEGHSDTVTSVAFSPDGARVVSGSEDRTVRVWDAQSGELVVGPMEGHSHDVYSVAFSLDGTRIASGSGDGTFRVWDAQSGELVVGSIRGHSCQVNSVAFSPDGTRIVSGSRDKTIRVWDARSGELIVGPMEGHTEEVNSVAFSPDGAKIASGSDDETIRVWDAQSGELVVGSMRGHSGQVNSVAFSPDGTRIVSGSWDDAIRIWDARSGELIVGPMEGHTEVVNSVAFSPDGAKIASGSDDRTIRVWDAQSGELVVGPIEGHSGSVTSVAFSPDSATIVSGSQSHDKTIRVWNIKYAQSLAARTVSNAIYLHHYPFQSLSINERGWIQNLTQDLLLWVPLHFCNIYFPPGLLQLVIPPATKIELTHALFHGVDWHHCASCTAPRQSQPLQCLPWPICTDSASG